MGPTGTQEHPETRESSSRWIGLATTTEQETNRQEQDQRRLVEEARQQESMLSEQSQHSWQTTQAQLTQEAQQSVTHAAVYDMRVRQITCETQEAFQHERRFNQAEGHHETRLWYVRAEAFNIHEQVRAEFEHRLSGATEVDIDERTRTLRQDLDVMSQERDQLRQESQHTKNRWTAISGGLLRYREEDTEALEAAQSQRDMYIHEATERTQELEGSLEGGIVSHSCPCPLTPAVSAVSHVSQLIPSTPPLPIPLELTGMQPRSTIRGHIQAPTAATTQEKNPQVGSQMFDIGRDASDFGDPWGKLP
eukprot:1219617-Amphidinium_carterae.1